MPGAPSSVRSLLLLRVEHRGIAETPVAHFASKKLRSGLLALLLGAGTLLGLGARGIATNGARS